MTDYRKYINALRKCAKEHDNDTTYTGHIIISDLCRDTANLLEALEQEPTLEKIRAEIEQRPYGIANESVIRGMQYERAEILEIIDKYRK